MMRVAPTNASALAREGHSPSLAAHTKSGFALIAQQWRGNCILNSPHAFATDDDEALRYVLELCGANASLISPRLAIWYTRMRG